MRLFSGRLAVVVLLLVALLACKKSKSYADGEAGLGELANDLAAADADGAKKIAESLKLPKPAEWFSATFGPELGAKLAADYEREAVQLPTIQGFFIAAKAKNRTSFSGIRVEDGSDNANVYQMQAIRAMKTPVTLYTILATEPGDDGGSTLWSFAHVDGSFRYVGKLKAANPSPGPLDEFRKKEVLKALKEKAGE